MAARHHTYGLSYSARAELPSTPPLAAFLFRLMAEKKTNLAVSADVTSAAELLALAEDVGDHICVFKTHADIVADFSAHTARALQEVASRKGFVIFEDRKLGDIGSTVQKQYTEGPFAISSWAEIVNAHIFPGPPIVAALSEAAEKAAVDYSSWADNVAPAFQKLGKPPRHGLLLLAQMSSAGCLMTAEYSRECARAARDNAGFVIGFIAQESLNSADSDNFITLAPGVKIVPAGQDAGDGLGQQYNSPDSMIGDKGVDVVIVGRGILAAPDRAGAAEQYRRAAWEAYQNRVLP